MSWTFVPGWVDTPERHAVAATLPTFAAVGPRTALGVGENTNVLLYKAWQDATGAYWPYARQEIGDCVSFGHAHGNDLLQCVEWSMKGGARGGLKREDAETDTEALYGMAREAGDMLGDQDGCFGSAAVKAMTTMGTVPRTLVGPYSGRRAKEWGRTGAPADVKEKAGKFKLGAAALVKTWDELVRSLGNGYPVTICTGAGFTMHRDEQGFCARQGHWGHCFPPGTLISGDVMRRAEDVQVGDMLTTHRGFLGPVTHRFERDYEGDLVVLKAVGLPAFRCTPEHPILVRRPVLKRLEVRRHWHNVFFGGSAGSATLVCPRRSVAWMRSELAWVPASEVRAGDQLVTPRSYDQFWHAPDVPAWAGCRNGGRNRPAAIAGPDPDLAWFFGLYIADGHSEPGHRIGVVLSSSETETIARACRVIESLGLKPRLVSRPRYVRIRVDSASVAASFAEWFGTSSLTKRIPPFLFRGWDLREVLNGIVAGDGCVNGRRHSVLTTSRVLAYQLRQLLVNLGEHPMVSSQKRGKGCYPNASPAWAVNWMTDPRRKSCFHRRDNYLSPVKKVSRVPYSGKVYNFEVAHDHSYVAGGVAVHNCMLVCAVRQDSRPGACIFQSWGPNVPDGPTTLDQPDNTFWIARQDIESILGEGDSWALSDAPFFTERPVPAHWRYGDLSGY